MISNKDIAAYFEESASWDADRTELAARNQRIAWVVAAAGWSCAVIVSIALALLSPLKTVVPYLIRVDNTTGLVDVVPQYTGTESLSETVARAVLTHYVDVCERFVWALAERDYEDCGAFNSPQLNQRWAATWALSNPDSPLNRFKDGTSVLVSVISVTFFKRASGVNDLAQVRYVKVTRRLDSADERPTHWIASIQYVRGTPSKDPRIRRWNLLGYRVVDFRVEPEILAADPSSPAANTRGSR